MSKHSYVLEPLLRPAVEYQSAAVAAACGAVAVYAPWALMLPPRLGYATGAIAVGFAAERFRQGWEVTRYQYGMKHYKVTRTRLHRVPRTKETIYLGEGFLWTQKHTQRKLDAYRPEAEPFTTLPTSRLILDKAVRLYEEWSRSEQVPGFARPLFQGIAFVTQKDSWWNPVRPIIDLGGSKVLHGVEPHERPVLLRQAARNGHVLVKGTTRVGKTRLLEVIVTQDIHEPTIIVIIIDPKGDADLMMRVYAEASRAGRLDHLYLFHLGYPDFSARYNGIGNFSRITEIATRTTNALPSSGNSAAFKEFSWRFTNLVAQAQVALGQVPTYNGLLRNITDIEPLFITYAKLSLDRAEKEGRITGWENVVANCATEIARKKIPVPRALQDRQPVLAATIIVARKWQQQIEDPILDGLSTAVSYEKSFFEKIIASLGPFLEKLTTGAIGKLISPDYFNLDDPRPIFDWMQVIRQGGIVYAGLDALSDPVIAGAVGNSMLADLVSIGGKIYKHGVEPDRPDGRIQLPVICAHFDEVEAILGDEFIPMVNRMGGAGMRVTAYTQTVSDLQAKLKDAAKAKQLLGNFNHVITLRTKDIDSAKFVTDQLPKVEVATLTLVSGVTDKAAEGDGIDFISNNQDRVANKEVPLIEPADIMQLPIGQAFALLEGNRLFKLRIPLADTSDDVHIPASLKAVCEDMRSRYRTSERWWKENDWFSDAMISLPIATPIILPEDAELNSDDIGAGDGLAVGDAPTGLFATTELGSLRPWDDAPAAGSGTELEGTLAKETSDGRPS